MANSFLTETQQDNLTSLGETARLAKYFDGIGRWATLSGEGTITGQFLAVFNQLGTISNSISKIAETAENSIKVLGL